MWELILLTLFEIASITIPTFLDKKKHFDKQIWTEAAKALQYSEVENEVKIIPYVEQVDEDVTMTFAQAENVDEEKANLKVDSNHQKNNSNSHEYSSAQSELSQNRLNEHQVDQILQKNSAINNFNRASETALAREEASS